MGGTVGASAGPAWLEVPSNTERVLTRPTGTGRGHTRPFCPRNSAPSLTFSPCWMLGRGPGPLTEAPAHPARPLQGICSRGRVLVPGALARVPTVTQFPAEGMHGGPALQGSPRMGAWKELLAGRSFWDSHDGGWDGESAGDSRSFRQLEPRLEPGPATCQVHTVLLSYALAPFIS